jgi:hypothetical protein
MGALMIEAELAVSVSDERGSKPVTVRVAADMVMYAALAGKPPEIDPTMNDPIKLAAANRRDHPWSPIVLSIYLRQICREKALKINRPELAIWLKKQSEIARKRLKETQKRIIAARSNRAA